MSKAVKKPDIEFVCPNNCGTFVFDSIPWHCGKCNQLMVKAEQDTK